MQEYEKINLINWRERKIIYAAEILLAIHLIYFAVNHFGGSAQIIWGRRIYLGILFCDCIFLLGFLGGCGLRVLRQTEEGIFIKSVKICFLLLLIFAILSFFNTLLLF